MTWRSSGDYSSYTSSYYSNRYQSMFETEQMKVSNLEKQVQFLKTQNNSLQDKLSMLGGKYTSLKDNLKEYKPFEDNVKKIKEKQQKIALINKKLEEITPELQTLIAKQNYSKAMELAQKHQRGLAKLADLMDEKRIEFEQPNAKVPDDFYLKLVEIYQKLLPENSKKYEQRCLFAIKLLEAEKENNIGNAELVKELEIQKLAFYIKVFLHCRHDDVSINETSMVQLLINPEKGGIEQSERGFAEAVADLAVNRGELQKRVTITQQPMDNLTKELDKVDEPKKITFLVKQMEELLVENKTLEEQKNNLETQFAVRGGRIDTLNEEIAQQKQKEEQQQQTLASKEQEIEKLKTTNSKIQKENQSLTEQLKTTQSELVTTKNTVKELKKQVKNLNQMNQQLKNNQENLYEIIGVKEKQIKELKVNKYNNAQALIRIIQDEIFEYKWDVAFFGGHQVFLKPGNKDKTVTGTAKKILDAIQVFCSAIDKEEDVDTKQMYADQCLHKIWAIADKGRQKSGLYRFIFQQNKSSVEKYTDFINKIEEQKASSSSDDEEISVMEL